MRIALLVVASLVAACRDGIEIEIFADRTATRVEVFVSSGAPTDAPAVRLDLVPAEVDAAVTGLAYPRDPGPDRTFGAQVGSDGRARVELAQAAGQTQLHALIAIGFDAADTIVSAGVLTDVDLSATPVRLIVELAPVARTRLGTGVPGLSAQVWGPDSPPPTARPGTS